MNTQLATFPSIFCAVLLWSTPGIVFSSEISELNGYWVVSPKNPGPDTPLQGESLFDELYKNQTGSSLKYSIPFPFSSIVNDLASRVKEQKRNPIPRALIPRGRSLQQEAAAPDYFTYPRHVIAVTGEPKYQQSKILRNRLFIAYQERSGQMEVISYNDGYGRFEFQVVNKYRKNETPVVEYASRATCMTCHQNGGPIFAKSPWSETNFKREIAVQIAQANPDKFPTFLSAISTDPSQIDLATDYANYISTAQLIWTQGCGTRDVAASIQCRGALLNAILQLGLNGGLAFDHKDSRFNQNVLSHIQGIWNEIWPGGLLIPTSDIPDLDRADIVDMNSALDPLSPRPPRAHWNQPNYVFLRGIVKVLTEFLSLDDYETTDSILSARVNVPVFNQKLTGMCTTQAADSKIGGSWTRLICSSAGVSTDNDDFDIEFELKRSRDQSLITDSVVQKLALPESSLYWKPLLVRPSINATPSGLIFNSGFSSSSGSSSLRSPSGLRLDSLTINFAENPFENHGRSIQSSFTVRRVNDYLLIQEAIDKMIQDTANGNSTILVAAPFNRKTILNELHAYLSVLP